MLYVLSCLSYFIYGKAVTPTLASSSISRVMCHVDINHTIMHTKEVLLGRLGISAIKYKTTHLCSLSSFRMCMYSNMQTCVFTYTHVTSLRLCHDVYTGTGTVVLIPLSLSPPPSIPYPFLSLQDDTYTIAVLVCTRCNTAFDTCWPDQ